ncbi:MAG: DUF4179 domain-containing protein [Anaerobacillus sp.]|uniref:DUF4179 domain-containing protein n=1 Tax=Anaerobacillus sp. TaxID=1872506 RepID=UPI00391C8FB5
MNNIEKRLEEQKKLIDTMTAPEQLEARLRSALQDKTRKPKQFLPVWKLAAVAIFFMMVVGYNYNAFAYYGKKLLGFDELINGTLQELNDEGLGQVVGKQATLMDGTELTINGIMADANRTILYYTLTNRNGIEDAYDYNLFRPSKITGFFTDADWSSGTAILGEDGTELKGTYDFEAVSPFSKTLTLHYWQQLENGVSKEESITFPYNPNKAMEKTIKKSIKKKVTVDQGTISFKSMQATPTMTVITGTVNVDNYDRVNLALHGIELIANGAPVEILGSSSGSSFTGTKFDIKYDALPKELNSLELIVKEFAGYQQLNTSISLHSSFDTAYNLSGKDLWINGVSVTEKGVEIRIATDEDVMLDGVSIKTKNEHIPLKTIIRQTETMQRDGRLMKDRTLIFETKQEPEQILIEGMHYMKPYNIKIEMPVN